MELRVFLILLASVFLGGCQSAGPVSISPDTYLISKSGGVWQDLGSLKVDVIREANAFAESRGKVAIPLSSKEVGGSALSPPVVEYQFRAIDKTDPEVRRTTLVPRADVVIESNVTHDAKTAQQPPKAPDLYSELVRLDDLRKRGLLTDAEFDAEKQKLLRR
jgi:hypothetical protein